MVLVRGPLNVGGFAGYAGHPLTSLHLGGEVMRTTACAAYCICPPHTHNHISPIPGIPFKITDEEEKDVKINVKKTAKTNAGHGILRLKCILSIVAIKCRSRGPACWSINKNALMLQGQHVTGPLFMFVQLEQGLQMARNYNNPLFRADIIRWPVNWG